MKSNKTIKIISVVCTVLVIFFLLVTITATVTEKRLFRHQHDYTDFSSGWMNEKGEEVRLEKITGSCRLHKVIPPMRSHQTLIMNARNLNVDVYIEDECVYKHSMPDNAFLRTIYGKTTGSDFIDVKITKESAGKTIYINAECPYSNTRSCKIVNVYFGNSTEIVKHSTAVRLASFSEMGKCYRIGGDEFVLISVCDNAEQKYTEAKENMDKYVIEADSRTDFPVSVAAGYSFVNGRSVKLKDVFDEADAKMYETKREMKEKTQYA